MLQVRLCVFLCMSFVFLCVCLLLKMYVLLLSLVNSAADLYVFVHEFCVLLPGLGGAISFSFTNNIHVNAWLLTGLQLDARVGAPHDTHTQLLYNQIY